MTVPKKHKMISKFIALVWFMNGMLCKVLNLVPRHEQIVSEILGADHSRLLCILIGISEIVMTVWILSGYKSRFNAILQIVIIATMNILEYLLAPDLLLWGKFNSFFAFMFICLIAYNEFVLNTKN